MGVLVLGDFNETGFEVMERLRQVVYAEHHPLGTMSVREAQPVLQSYYTEVEEKETPLNSVFIVGDLFV